VSKAEGTLPQVIISQDHSPPTNVLAHRGYHFLPHLLHTVSSPFAEEFVAFVMFVSI